MFLVNTQIRPTSTNKKNYVRTGEGASGEDGAAVGAAGEDGASPGLLEKMVPPPANTVQREKVSGPPEKMALQKGQKHV